MYWGLHIFEYEGTSDALWEEPNPSIYHRGSFFGDVTSDTYTHDTAISQLAEGQHYAFFGISEDSSGEDPIIFMEETFNIERCSSSGFITGGGWFIPEDDTDKVNFGFEVKRKKDGTLKGNLEMIDHSTDSNYKAIDFTYFDINDNVAYLHGNLMINGEGSYPFRAVMEDNGSPGKNNDKFYIDIQIGEEHTVFDEVIDGGSIVIHK